MRDKNGNYTTKSTVKLTATETSRKIEFDIPADEAHNVTATLLKNNHLRGMYKNYCFLNQDFLQYIVSCNLSGTQSKVLFYLFSDMDVNNKILLNNQIIMKNLNISESTVIRTIAKLIDKKIILKQKLSVAKYEYQIRTDMISPSLAFKNKANKDNVAKHKALMAQETPYIKQYNTNGNIDLVNPETGEVFKTIEI